MPQQPQKNELDLKRSFNLVYGIAKCQATCVTPFIRVGFGTEALGFPALGALVAYCFWIMGTESFDLESILLWWFMAIIAQRGWMFVRYLRGGYEHSRHDGFPLLTGWLCRSDTWAKLMEGALVMAAGAFVEELPWAIGRFLFISGGAIIFVEMINHQYHQKREQAMRDQVIEMQATTNPLTGHSQWQMR